MSYINTVNYAAWHIPCYNGYNCPDNVQIGTEVQTTLPPESNQTNIHNRAGVSDHLATSGMTAFSSDLLSGFVFILSFLALVCNVTVISCLLCRRGFRRPLHIFLLSVLTCDLMLILMVMPMHALSDPSLCLSWIYIQLAVLGAR